MSRFFKGMENRITNAGTDDHTVWCPVDEAKAVEEVITGVSADSISIELDLIKHCERPFSRVKFHNVKVALTDCDNVAIREYVIKSIINKLVNVVPQETEAYDLELFVVVNGERLPVGYTTIVDNCVGAFNADSDLHKLMNQSMDLHTFLNKVAENMK